MTDVNPQTQTQQTGTGPVQQKQNTGQATQMFPQHPLWQQAMIDKTKTVNGNTNSQPLQTNMGNYVIQTQYQQQQAPQQTGKASDNSSLVTNTKQVYTPEKNEHVHISKEPYTTDSFMPTLQEITKIVGSIEKDLGKIKALLSNIGLKKTQETDEKEHEQEIEVIQGIYDGVNMIGPDKKKYPVPTNYASKSKLIPGDKLKLKILASGQMVYKVIELAERQTCKAILSKDEKSDRFVALRNNKVFLLNQAAVTYFKGKVGDDVYILINKQTQEPYAAIEAIVKQ